MYILYTSFFPELNALGGLKIEVEYKRQCIGSFTGVTFYWKLFPNFLVRCRWLSDICYFIRATFRSLISALPLKDNNHCKLTKSHDYLVAKRELNNKQTR